jgi:hypothetical protein
MKKNIMQNLIYRIAKFASTIPTTGARYANSKEKSSSANRGSSIFLKVFAEHMTKLLNGDEDGPKVRAAERASNDISFIVGDKYVEETFW